MGVSEVVGDGEVLGDGKGGLGCELRPDVDVTIDCSPPPEPHPANSATAISVRAKFFRFSFMLDPHLPGKKMREKSNSRCCLTWIVRASLPGSELDSGIVARLPLPACPHWVLLNFVRQSD